MNKFPRYNCLRSKRSLEQTEQIPPLYLASVNWDHKNQTFVENWEKGYSSTRILVGRVYSSNGVDLLGVYQNHNAELSTRQTSQQAVSTKSIVLGLMQVLVPVVQFIGSYKTSTILALFSEEIKSPFAIPYLLF